MFTINQKMSEIWWKQYSKLCESFHSLCSIGRCGHVAKWPFWELSPMLGLGLELEGKALLPYKASGAYIILPQIKRC